MKALSFLHTRYRKTFCSNIKCGRRELLQFLMLHALLVIKKTFAYPTLQFAPKITENYFKINEALNIDWILYIVGNLVFRSRSFDVGTATEKQFL
jgi:hypothetical protein